MKIMAEPSAPFEVVFPRSPAGRFQNEMFTPLWTAARDRGVDPVGVIAQAMKETNNGNYGGKVKPEFYNTCGLKVRHMNLFPGITDGDNPLAHQMFPNWRVGATAHVQHLMAYAGVVVLHESIVSPRYIWVIGNYSDIVHFEDLGGRTADGRIKWAPSPTYGQELVAIARRLSA